MQTRYVAAAVIAVMAAPAAAQSERSVVPLAQGWEFQRGGDVDPAQEAQAPGSWERVSVPHTWNRVGYYMPDPQTHLNRAESVDKYQGVGWYRMTFTPPAMDAGQRAWLQFDAASRTAEVWLNGQRIGGHKGGFSRFRLDATRALRAGQANTLLVKVDNTQPAQGSSTADILPLAGNFFVHGGLYRPVSLIVTNAVHVDMLDAGGSGIFATTRSIDAAMAKVDVRVRIRNDGTKTQAVNAVVRLIDAGGKTVATGTRRISLRADSASESVETLSVATPHLWNGVADPYLHRLVVEIATPSGAVLDRVEQAFGIREMRADPARGFMLNGKPLRLHGVGYHQDREGKGWATAPADIEQDFAIMREMGVNSIRLTHYQHGQVIHDLADRYGMVLWDEIPLVSRWTWGDDAVATAGLRDDARQQLRELIRQNGNHASVFNWGIANEVDFGKSLPAFITTSKDTPAPDPLPLLRELNALAKSEDPSRATALATCCEGRLLGSADIPITAVAADLGGANRYFGWYYGQPGDLGKHLDSLRALRPNQPVSVTEYGAGGATTIHTDNPLGGKVDQRGRNQPEEYESYIHETAWATLSAKPYLWGTWLWNSFDFATTVRREGDAIDINTKGLVTYDRKIRKDAYYFYKANWTATPTVHVAGRRYVDRAYPVADVRVYSNAPRTDLLVNDRVVGTLSACPQMICAWSNVALAVGANRVVARGVFPTGAVDDAIEWRVAADAARSVRIDSGALVAPEIAGKRYGSDAFFDGGRFGDINAYSGYGPRPEKKVVAGTTEGAVAETYREGRFGYRVPLANGRYTVELSFVEPALAAGARQFDVVANGKRAIAALDIAAVAGAPLTRVTRRIVVGVTDGMLDLKFVPIKGDAIVSGIEITR
ncbi:glycoside hydrolase family 2 TIM barrel-domain containing protein [Sphingomonas sp. CFBP 13706]|uniref:glycoside hydrolase family 2 TIM barrel-domain containing protein n=1 Tax=Sphingomonas sp. CFBP 13706 TaxID=2775314 RepID=UPI001785CFFE|nr:glycoside hydrolase family 2 TIM barrel-domain containing protein [Sphingomonas sp. CFBP 13706]MBD8735665.1 beta galactosidase jelly roll domain-containing protein [Sphingomonas sp. CFBP 13706]